LDRTEAGALARCVTTSSRIRQAPATSTAEAAVRLITILIGGGVAVWLHTLCALWLRRFVY